MSAAENITLTQNRLIVDSSFQTEVFAQDHEPLDTITTIGSDPMAVEPSKKKKMQFSSNVSPLLAPASNAKKPSNISGLEAPTTTNSSLNMGETNPDSDPPVAVTFSTTSNITSDQQKDQELQQRLEAMAQFTLAFNQYLQARATQNQVEENTQSVLTPEPEPSPEVQQAGFDMLGYMLAIMNAAILCMQNQAIVGQQTTDMAQASVELAQMQLDEANANYDKLMKEERSRGFFGKIASAFKALGDLAVLLSPPGMAAKMLIDLAKNPHSLEKGLHSFSVEKALHSFSLEKEAVSKIGDEYKAQFVKFCQDNEASGGMFTALIAITMIAAAPFTGGTSMAVMAAFMLLMEVSGGQEALNNLIEKVGPVWAQVIVEVLILVVEAVALAGISGLADAAIAGSEASANIAMKAGESAEEIEMTTFADGAEEAGAVALDTSITASNSMQSTLENILNTLKDAVKRAFGETAGSAVRSIGGKTLILASTTSLWSDLTRSLLELSNACGANISDETEDRVSAITGMTLDIIGAICGGLLEFSAGSSDLPKALSSKLGEATFDTLKTTIGAITSMLILQQATYNILYGMKLITIGEILQDLAEAQGTQALLADILDRIQMISASNSSSMNALGEVNNAVSRRMSIFVTEWNAFV